MKRYCLTVILVATILFNFPLPAISTHAVDHRFTIYGAVYDNDGKPVQNSRVIIRDTQGISIEHGNTDRSGRFRLLLHLHNDDLGRRLLVETESGKQEIKVSFDPFDKKTERKVEVNFGKPSFNTESNTESSPSYLRYITGIFLVIFAFTLYVMTRSRKSKKVKAKKRHKGKRKRR